MASVVVALCFVALAIPVALIAAAIALFVRLSRGEDRDLAELRATQGLGEGATGSVAGVPVAIDNVTIERATRVRFRAVSHDPARARVVASRRPGLRAHGDLAGLVDRPTGDGAFDAAFAAYAAPNASPDLGPVARAALLQLAAVCDVIGAARTPEECTVAVYYGATPVVIERAAVLAAALTSAAKEAELAPRLAAPIGDPAARLRAATKFTASLAGASFLGLCMAPIAMIPPFVSLVELVGCGPREHLQFVGRGRGSATVCVGPGRAQRELSTGWTLLVGSACGTILVTSIVAAILAARANKRRAR